MFLDEELKPTHFPPLPTLLSDLPKTVIQPTKRSIADIVKSQPTKKEEKKEEKKQENVDFPSLCIQSDEFKNNPFSYADMLKRKDQQQ